VCFPGLTLYAFGERQDAHLPLSSLQEKCEPALEEVNLKLALAVLALVDTTFFGCLVMVVCGAVFGGGTLTVKVREAGLYWALLNEPPAD